MIDFSQYTEHEPFTTEPLVLENVGYPIDPFQEAIFELKRNHYINFLKLKIDGLLVYLERGASGYSSLPDNSTDRTDYLNKFEIIESWISGIYDNYPPKYFYKEQPKNESANCLGTDYVYDFYRNIPNYASRLRGLYTYEEYFVEMFDDVYSVVYQIFNKIGTRGQFYGYLDNQVSIFGDAIDSYINVLESSSGNWKDILNNSEILKNNYDTSFNLFKNNIIQAASDMRLIIEPIVKYLNIINDSANLMNSSWGNISINEGIDNVLTDYFQGAVTFVDDYHISNIGLSGQITENFKTYIKDDRSNLELMIIKMVATTFQELNIRQILEQLHLEIVIPDYN
jgi:hypothetical protein